MYASTHVCTTQHVIDEVDFTPKTAVLNTSTHKRSYSLERPTQNIMRTIKTTEQNIVSLKVKEVLFIYDEPLHQQKKRILKYYLGNLTLRVLYCINPV